ncbi:MAG: OB-fold nucleic acid binding domain-containing protein, partial [Bacteroidales bacterium]
MKKMTVKEALLSNDFHSEITVMGWVRTKRTSKNVAFVALNDGSTLQNIQLVFDASKFPEKELGKVTTGAALEVKGTLTESAGTQQSCEVTVSALTIVGESDPDLYPLQPKKHSLEFLREIAHLRFRTNTFSAIFRIRHHMIFAVHQFFNDKGFYNIHTPIITASDAEGAGEMFHVSVLNPLRPPLTEEGKINYKEDFFGRETSLTVSGQLEAELAALALSKV